MIEGTERRVVEEPEAMAVKSADREEAGRPGWRAAGTTYVVRLAVTLLLSWGGGYFMFEEVWVEDLQL